VSEGRSEIDNQTEEDRTGNMGEETWSMFRGYVAEYGEMLDEAIVSEHTAIVDCELVLLHDVGMKHFDRDSHVLEMLHGSTLTGIRMYSKCFIWERLGRSL
jgi:hypothetical protein